MEWTNTEDPESYWIEVTQQKNALGEARFENISKLAIGLLSLPFSNATVERAFSLVNVIKNKIRNRLAIHSTDAILRVRFHLMDIGCVNFRPTEKMFKKFNSKMYQIQIPDADENNALLDVLSDVT